MRTFLFLSLLLELLILFHCSSGSLGKELWSTGEYNKRLSASGLFVGRSMMLVLPISSSSMIHLHFFFLICLLTCFYAFFHSSLVYSSRFCLSLLSMVPFTYVSYSVFVTPKARFVWPCAYIFFWTDHQWVIYSCGISSGKPVPCLFPCLYCSLCFSGPLLLH